MITQPLDEFLLEDPKELLKMFKVQTDKVIELEAKVKELENKIENMKPSDLLGDFTIDDEDY